MKKLMVATQRTLSQLITELRQTFLFYTSIGDQIADYCRDLIGNSVSRAEISLPRQHESPMFSWNHQEWSVQMPDCCVVCGEATTTDWIDEQTSVTDMRPALFLPAIALVLGVLSMGWGFPWWTVWVTCLIAAGAARRLSVQLPGRIRYRRCEDDCDVTAFPHVRAFCLLKDKLIIRVGRRSVMNAYFESEQEASRNRAGKRRKRKSRTSPETTAPKPRRTSIPLADDAAVPDDTQSEEELENETDSWPPADARRFTDTELSDDRPTDDEQ